MLAGSFYKIVQEQSTAGNRTVTIELNAAHAIFGGHFPGQPVVPGVCMMQIIQELLEGSLGKKVLLQKASNMKFLNMIDPVQQPLADVVLQYAEEGDQIKVTTAIKRDDKVFLKFQGIFSVEM
ncbi:3-hydroxyacyl-ACP dehydratase [Chitinophaga defluvii]|uniref:3-hydroxyacyl-ACP dehydratase n=1 Tax=Chitinophaga defluvii TaxID=3163343 RepID=A0ABV2TCT6_9BACT